MSGWNLPPGVSVSQIPGNSDEDYEWESALDWLADDAASRGLDDQEMRVVWQLGVAAFAAGRLLGSRFPFDRFEDEPDEPPRHPVRR